MAVRGFIKRYIILYCTLPAEYGRLRLELIKQVRVPLRYMSLSVIDFLPSHLHRIYWLAY